MPATLPGMLSNPMDFTPDMQSARAQLGNFLPRAGSQYAEQRNHDYGPDARENISCLSPYIRHRLITEQEVLRSTLSRFAPSTAEKFIAEVFWRGYFKGWLEHHPSVWTDYKAQVLHYRDQVEGNSGLGKAYNQAINGQTGIDCFDAWAQELVQYGYLHNHARMWFASIWIFTLRLPWALGADFFLTHLLDGDAASNTCSWRWVAGLHTKGKNYLARASNIARYTDGRFAPSGLNEKAEALQEEAEHPRQQLNPPQETALPDNFALLLHAEECASETLPLNDKAPSLLLGLKPNWSALKAPLSYVPSDQVQAFANGAVDDALARGKAHFDCAAMGVANADKLINSMREAGLSELVLPYIPIGPLSDIWAARADYLAENGINIITILRDYDRLVWPHAGRGFFKLKQKIPDILDELALG